jgi:hypothetical protein
MLIVYLVQFEKPQIALLTTWAPAVSYWPRSYAYTELYNSAVPTDWWLLFSDAMYADIWLIKYPEQSRIVRTLFD